MRLSTDSWKLPRCQQSDGSFDPRGFPSSEGSFLSVPLTPKGHLPSPVTGSRREQGFSGSFLVPTTFAPSRGKSSMTPALWSLIHQQSLEPQYHTEAEAGAAPLWSPREESSSESKRESFLLSKAHHWYQAYAAPDFSTNPSCWHLTSEPLAYAVAILEPLGVPPVPSCPSHRSYSEVSERWAITLSHLALDPNSDAKPRTNVQEMWWK